MIDNGRLAFGSDYPVESPTPFRLAAGMSREDAQGRPQAGWLQPRSAWTIETAFAAFTSMGPMRFAGTGNGRLANGHGREFH
jgi:predicted amidohydrolase YtcJ